MRRLLHRVDVLRAYLPLLWRDEDYDYAFLLALLNLKFRRMARHFREHNITEDAAVVALSLDLAATFCDEIREKYPLREAEQACESLGMTIGRDLMTWWD